MKLKNKIALITGSSRGIGASIAIRYAREGASVAVVAHKNIAEGQLIADEIVSEGGSAAVFSADVGTVDGCSGLVEKVVAHFGTLDILVNNAAVFNVGSIEKTTEEMWDKQINVNLKGSFFMIKAAVPLMKEKGKGKIINITSIAAVGGFPDAAAYCSSKGGQLLMVKALCLELAKHGININSLAPENTKTDMNKNLREVSGYDEGQRALTPANISHMDADDLGGAAVFLASDDSNMVHGANLLVDGGWAAW